MAVLLTVAGANRTYTLIDNGSGATRNVLGRFQITDSAMTVYTGNTLPRTHQNIGKALQDFGKHIERHEASLI